MGNTATEPTAGAALLIFWLLLTTAALLLAALIEASIPRPITAASVIVLALGDAALLLRLRAVVGTLQRLRQEDKEKIGESEIVIAEARHRLKNLIAIIGAIAKNSRRQGDAGIDDYLARFLGRLRALGEAGDQVLSRRNADVEVRELVVATLKPFMAEHDRLFVDGPELVLHEQTGGSLAFAVHELATNALKYGALSVPDGTARFEWRKEPLDAGERVIFAWCESGGPLVQPPEREGFGSRLIRFTAAQEKDHAVDLSWQPGGLTCTISFLLERRPALRA